jgi:hypothetical protein
MSAEPNSQPTRMDHRNLNFWLSACISDGEEFLKASRELSSIPPALARLPHEERMAIIERRKLAQERLGLTKYHFVSTMGSLLRHLERTHSLFPSIKGPYEKAEHLRKEGKDLRDMIEHADQYVVGKGRKQDQFVRAAEGVATNLPGDQAGTADATALIVDKNGHWLGGRLNVEPVIAEVRAISAEAEKIPPPSS